MALNRVSDKEATKELVTDTLILDKIKDRIKGEKELVITFNSLRTYFFRDFYNTPSFETTEKLIRDCVLRNFKFISGLFTIEHTEFNRSANTRLKFKYIENSSLFDHSCGWGLYARTNTEDVGEING